MSRAFPVLVALLLVLCSPAAAYEAGSPSSTPTTPGAKNPVKPPGFNNTSSHLSLGTPDRSETYTPSLSLSTALEMDRNELQAQKGRYTLDEQLANAETSGEKQQVLIHYRYTLQSELSALQNKERAIGKQFNNQEITTEEYISRLAVLDAKSRDISGSIEYMEDKGNSVPRFSPNGWQLKAKLLPIQGQVRRYVTEEIRGQKTPRPVYVATTENGVVLSTIDGNQYVREAYRDDYRASREANQIVLETALNLTHAQYPWVDNHTEGQWGMNLRYGNGIWPSNIPYTHGVVKPYLDGSTKKIFREIQYKYLTGSNHIPYGEPIRNNSTSLTLVVNRSYPGGPLRINLTDANGDPVRGSIDIGETDVGKTGPEGTLWTVAPGREFTVSATHNAETVNVTVTPYGVTSGNSTGGETQPPQSVGESTER